MSTLALWILRIGVFGTFAGHGTVALLGNEKWLPYLGIVGIEPPFAYDVMFTIGLVDWLVALWVLIKPSRYVLIYAFIWAFLAALARPLSGESWLGFVERASNWAVPLTLFIVLYYDTKPLAVSDVKA